MHRTLLLEQLNRYSVTCEQDQIFLTTTKNFVNNNSRCFERSLDTGHITGSAWIINSDRTKALLTLHRGINKWIQLGGHADGQTDMHLVSLREAQEESGLSSIKSLSKDIFDIDIHIIARMHKEPEHYHYDIRFLFEASNQEELVLSNESKDLAWIDIREHIDSGVDETIGRMCRKT